MLESSNPHSAMALSLVYQFSMSMVRIATTVCRCKKKRNCVSGAWAAHGHPSEWHAECTAHFR